MSARKRAYIGSDIFDGTDTHSNSVLLVDDAIVTGIVPKADIPPEYKIITLSDGLITPGFVDLQVNGGGGVMFNDAPTPETIKTICDAHLPFGTTSLLPTLITDAPEKTTQAIEAARQAIASGVEGVIGLHLEGPHLSRDRKGAHDPSLIREMGGADLEELTAAAETIQSLFLTVAPESVSQAQISDLTKAGAVVSIGHTNTTHEQAINAAIGGATCVTHIFNAMSQLGNREPGVVGAALNTGTFYAGLIADGFHVDPATIKIALKAKTGPGEIFLVSDAMATIGTDMTHFQLNGREILRNDGRLTLADGTLAGADLDMISAVRFMVRTVGVTLEEALRMASLYPARLLKREHEIGQISSGCRADFIHMDSDLHIVTVWRGGIPANT